jgi:hypothetical protein
MNRAKKQGVLLGATKKDFELKCKAENMRVARWDGEDDMTIGDVRTVISELECPPGDFDVDALRLLPLENPEDDYILVDGPDVDVAAITGQSKPKKLVGGTPYAICLPMASTKSLSRIPATAKNVYWKLKTVTLDGPEMEEVKGIVLGMVDGLVGFVRKDALMFIRVCLMALNGQCINASLLLVSGESGWAVGTGLRATQSAARRMFGAEFTHFIGDAAPGMVKAFKSLANDRLKGTGVHPHPSPTSHDADDQSRSKQDDDHAAENLVDIESEDEFRGAAAPDSDSDIEADVGLDSAEYYSDSNTPVNVDDFKERLYQWGRCTVHLIMKDLPPKRKSKTYRMDSATYDRFTSSLKQVFRFPPKWFMPAWEYVAQRFRDEGHNEWIELIWDCFIDPKKSGAPMVGSTGARCLPTHTNDLETSHRGFREDIKAELEELKSGACLPVRVTTLAKVLKVLWPRWVNLDTEKMKRTTFKRTRHEVLSHANFLGLLKGKDPRILNTNGKSGTDACFAFKQKSKMGPLYDLGEETPKAAVHCWDQEPPEQLTRRQYKLMSQIMFTTCHACLCWTWANKGGCYHVDSVREFQAMESLADVRDKPVVRGIGRGRKRRQKKEYFSSPTKGQGETMNDASDDSVSYGLDHDDDFADDEVHATHTQCALGACALRTPRLRIY